MGPPGLFALTTVLSLVSAQTSVDAGRQWEQSAAVALTLGLLLLGLAVLRRQLPAWIGSLVLLGYLIVIVLLRDAHGGASSDFALLSLMPVSWAAMFGSKRQLVLTLAAVALVFVGPSMFIGAERYPSSSWRDDLIWTLVLGVVGYCVRARVSDIGHQAGMVREQARALEEHAHELAKTQAALQTVALLARQISSSSDARALICETAISGAGASLATLVEPDGRGGFQMTGSAGIPIDFERLRSSVRPNASLRAFYARAAVFVADVESHEGVSELIVKATGLKSMLYEPIIRDGRPVGILCVGWTTPRQQLDDRTATVIAFLAAEAGAAIERADLVDQLEVLANTDPLTGLPNRRYWDTQLPKALANGGTSPLCVGVVDLDHFKHYNDRHGHQAGDKLLRDAATAWRKQLRTNDLLARYGGEEFAVLLPGSALCEAEQALQRLRAATPTVTCSAGLAQHEPGETADQLIDRADHALYQAKRNGRNRLIAA
jgi:diguanylate cyclase (GGDEF)-like protein